MKTICPPQECSLCSTKLPKHAVVDEDLAFCCPGCQAVFRILQAKDELDDFKESPIFHQAVEVGLISNPQLLEDLRRSRPEVSETERQKLYLEIGEMWCPSCAEIIRLFLLRNPGVIHAVVDYATDLAAVEFSPRHIGRDEVIELIRALGYTVSDLKDREGRAVSRSLLLRFGVATFCALNIMMLVYPIYAGFFQNALQGLTQQLSWLAGALSVPVITYSAWPIWRRLVSSWRVGILGMETLVGLGVSSAFGLSCYELWSGGTHVYFDSLSMIVVFVLLGKIIEARAKFSAKETLFRLSRGVPRRGRKCFPDGSSRFVPVKEIGLGDLLEVHTGEKVVLDGEVMWGEGACDESLMTGEPIPIPKQKGDRLIGGGILRSGSMRYRVTATAEQSTLQQIIQMVERGIEYKPNDSRLVDRIVRLFVPVVLALAATTVVTLYLGGAPIRLALLRGVSVLLISCPCAIGIAAPLAESLMMSACAQLGAIIRNRACLRYLGKEDVWVFDKTGTVTQGRFRLLRGLDPLSEKQKGVLAAMVRRSIHPLSVAIAEALPSMDGELDRLDEVAGKGLRAVQGSETYLLGSALFLREAGIRVPKVRTSERESLVFFADRSQCLTVLFLGDEVRREAPSVVERIGRGRCELLSGDGADTVASVARYCGFERWYGEVSPLQKTEHVMRLRESGRIVGMVGDGINDAPALARAQVAVSVMSATDLSIQVSDVLLSSEDLSVLPKLLDLGRRGRRTVAQNLAWAFGYNVLGLALAVGGCLSPLFASFAMAASSVAVVLNALRLKR